MVQVAVAADRVRVRGLGSERALEVLQVIDKRVGASAVASCLIDHSPPRPKAADVFTFQRDPATGRPTKKDRRALDRLRNLGR